MFNSGIYSLTIANFLIFLYILPSECSFSIGSASLLLSVTYCYAFSSHSFCSTGNARLFLLHFSLNSRQCSISSALGVGKWNSTQFLNWADLHPAMCWSVGTPQRLQKGENTKRFLTLCRAQVWTQRREEGKTVKVDLLLSRPCLERQVLLLGPCLQGNSLWPWGLLPKTFSSFTFVSPFFQGRH